MGGTAAFSTGKGTWFWFAAEDVGWRRPGSEGDPVLRVPLEPSRGGNNGDSHHCTSKRCRVGGTVPLILCMLDPAHSVLLSSQQETSS